MDLRRPWDNQWVTGESAVKGVTPEVSGQSKGGLNGNGKKTTPSVM